MKHLLLLLLLAVSVASQAPADKTPNSGDSPDKKAAAKLHEDAVHLMELSGGRERFQSKMKSLVAEGRKSMMDKCPPCTPAFGDEWEKRMLARLNPQDFVDVWVGVYEKYLTDGEINELISLHQQEKASPPPQPSPALKKKLDDVMPSLMGEALGKCAAIGAKLGGEVGRDIEKEHPEYIKPAANAGENKDADQSDQKE